MSYASTDSTRAFKGMRLSHTPDDYTVFDLETTGLSPASDAIIEIGAIQFRGDQEIARFSSLIDPGFEITKRVTAVTGITNDLLYGMPSIDTVLPDFLDFVGDDILIGHNVHFDVNFVYDACEAQCLPPFSNDFVDTLRLARQFYPDCPCYKLQDVARYLHIPQPVAHRALADVETTSACYAILKSASTSHAARPRQYKASIYPCSCRDVQQTTQGCVDESNPLYGRICVFTGDMEHLTRAEAMRIVLNIGGVCADSVTRKTGFLIIGDKGSPFLSACGKSTKQQYAEALILKGCDIQILSERAFLDLISDYQNAVRDA